MKRVQRIVVLLVIITGLGMLCFRFLARSTSLFDSLVPRAGASEFQSGRDDRGFGAAFDVALEKIGQISPDEFAQRYRSNANYLSKLDWDPTQSEYYDRFALDPKKPGAQVRARGEEEKQMREWAKKRGKPYPEDQPIMLPIYNDFDFRLDDEELAVFKANGFVVSERMSAPSCTDMFYRIYKRDLPVFITTDSVLHAWHRSYDAILEELETAVLMPALNEILTAIAKEVPRSATQLGDGMFKDSVLDADFFLAVARSLLADKLVDSQLGQNEKVARILEKCRHLQLEKLTLFGKERHIDFSQFKPRGHYEKSAELQRYFRAMIWCGRIDFRVAGNPDESSERMLAGAVVMRDLMMRSGKFELWSRFDRIIQAFVGQTDSMTFAQLDVLLTAGGIRSAADVKNPAMLDALSARIEKSDFGAQEIRGDVFVKDDNALRLVLPRSFTVLGQKFAIDSWVTSKVVYDDIWWDKWPVRRRIPSCLDVSFAAFGNDQVVPILVDRMKNENGRAFRDGLNYQHNLAAVRTVIDAKPAELWEQSVYASWLGCLREMSKPTTDTKYPKAMRTNAWAMKSLNSQLASWTQLRHNTILYVKQSYTSVPGCHYPAGFVEPVPEFWAKLKKTAALAAALLEAAPHADGKLRAKHAEYFKRFVKSVGTLEDIAKKELANLPLNDVETKFLEEVLEVKSDRYGSAAILAFDGWYPGLYYAGRKDARKWDALVADVHTDPPAPLHGDPGCVLHQGVGSVDLLMIAIDNGKERMTFAGPVLSHYEFEMPGVTRKSDAEWKDDLRAARGQPRPEWTRSYLVPGSNPATKEYGKMND